jgi:hypothetical protein
VADPELPGQQSYIKAGLREVRCEDRDGDSHTCGELGETWEYTPGDLD